MTKSKVAAQGAQVTVLHNPRCSKSRRALELLREHGATVSTVEYLREPLGRETLLDWIRSSGDSPIAFVRLEDAARLTPGASITVQATPEQIAELLVAHPALLQRPVARRGDRVVVGRPPERVLELLAAGAKR